MIWRRSKAFYGLGGLKVISTKTGGFGFLDPYIHVNLKTGELMSYDLGYKSGIDQALKIKKWEI